MRKYLKGKTYDIQINIKNKDIRGLRKGIKKFKEDCQPRNNLVKDINGGLNCRIPQYF